LDLYNFSLDRFQVSNLIVEEVQVRDSSSTPLKQGVILRFVVITSLACLTFLLFRLVLIEELLELILRVLLPEIVVLFVLRFKFKSLGFDPVQIPIDVGHHLPDFEEVTDFWQIVPNRVLCIQPLELTSD
jgi:hypothetical protein